MRTKLKFVPGSEEEFPGIECQDGRMLLLDCAEGPGDEAFLKRLAVRYNVFEAAADSVFQLLHADICPYCGRDNTDTELRFCTADDCPGAGLMGKMKKGLR